MHVRIFACKYIYLYGTIVTPAIARPPVPSVKKKPPCLKNKNLYSSAHRPFCHRTLMRVRLVRHEHLVLVLPSEEPRKVAVAREHSKVRGGC